MKLKYVVYPGTVISQYDAQWHYITSDMLIRLYGVRPEECLVFDRNKLPHPRQIEMFLERARELNLIALYPQRDGDYTVPKMFTVVRV